jgi:hypothetical protein
VQLLPARTMVYFELVRCLYPGEDYAHAYEHRLPLPADIVLGQTGGGFRAWRCQQSAGAHHTRAPPLRRRDRPRPAGADCSTVSMIRCERVTRRSAAVRSRGRIIGFSAGGVGPSASKEILIQLPASKLSPTRPLPHCLTVIIFVEIPHSVIGLGLSTEKVPVLRRALPLRCVWRAVSGPPLSRLMAGDTPSSPFQVKQII